MIFNRSSSAWVLTILQTLFAFFFCFYLSKLLPPGTGLNLSQAPTWYVTLFCLNFGLALLLAAFSLWKYELTGIVLLVAVHVVCPLIFFTDLTRNPYFTQIVLLNLWIAFLWASWFWDNLSTGFLVVPRTAADIPLIAFFLIATISWGVSFLTHEKFLHPAMVSEGIKGSLFLILNAIAVLYMAAMVEEKWRIRFIWITFCVAVIASIYGLGQYYGFEEIWSKTLTPFANRPVSTFGNPNFLSSYLLLVIPLLAVSVLIAEGLLKYLLSLGMLLIVITGLIATMTRSTWVGALVSLSLLACSGGVRSLVRKNLRRSTVFIALLLISVVFWPKSNLGGYRNPWERIAELHEIFHRANSAYGYHPWHQRILIWSCSFSMLKDHLLLGKGWGLMELFYPFYQGKELFHPILGEFRTHANNSHNEILEIWSQTGFLGMGAYAWLWVLLILYGIQLDRSGKTNSPPANSRSGASPPPSYREIWGWALTSAAAGMLVDNFFGNVSLHFAVPGFLFWWQAGLLLGIERLGAKMPSFPVLQKGGTKDPDRSPWARVLPIQDNGKKLLVWAGITFLLASSVFNFRREFQEIYYFLGFKTAKSGDKYLDVARGQLEEAWIWFPREVNTNYELSNTYARLFHQAVQSGLKDEADQWRKKAIWGYCESLHSNCGYDEIFFNLGAVQSQMGWFEDNFPDFTLTSPRGFPITESAQEIHGAIFNYSRALAINPLSVDAYSFLGNVYLQNLDRYSNQAGILFKQALHLFPDNKDFWVNLAYVQIKARNLDQAYQSLRNAMMIDPFYDLTRRNLRALLIQLKRTSDPLTEADKNLLQLQGLIQNKQWEKLSSVGEELVKELPENSQMHFILANSYFELHRLDKAESEYLQALKINPQHAMALNNLAYAYRAGGRNPEARKVYQRILELNPNDEQAKNMLKILPQ